MSENSKKHLRKAKLVPRDFDTNNESWHYDSEKVSQTEDPSSELQTKLPKIKTKIDTEVSYESTSRDNRFSVEIEVEPVEMEVSCEEDDYGDQSSAPQREFSQVEVKFDMFYKIHYRAIPYNGYNIDATDLKPVIILKEDLDKEMKKAMSLPSSYADKQIEIEIRRSLHTFLRAPQMEPQEQSLQAAIEAWRVWAAQAKSKRHTILLYKCFICNLGMWHLQPFREHLRKHDELKLCIDIDGTHEASIMASFGGSIESVCMLKVDGVCYRCQRTYEQHLEAKKGGFYRCQGCWERFPTCDSMFLHEGNCYRYQKIVFASAQIMNDSYWKCTVCDIKCLTESRFNTHLADFHDVRSDLFVEPFPMKKCTLCDRDFFVNNVHLCLKKPFHINCLYCPRMFQNKFFRYMHETFNSKAVTCKLCPEVLPSQCAEVQHLIRHSDKYTVMYRCIFCASYVLFHNECVAKRHQAGHVGKLFKRKVRYEPLIVPKSVLFWKSSEDITISSMNLLAFDPEKEKENKAIEGPSASVLPSDPKEMPKKEVTSNTGKKRKKSFVDLKSYEDIVNLDSDSDSNHADLDPATEKKLQSKAETEANASIMSVHSLESQSKKARLNLNEELDIKDEVVEEYNEADDLDCEIEDEEMLIQSILKQKTALKQTTNEAQEDTDKEIEDEENEIQQFFFNSLGGKSKQAASAVLEAKETTVVKSEEKSRVEINEVIDLDEIDDDYYSNVPAKQNDVIVKKEKEEMEIDASQKVSSVLQTDEIVNNKQTDKSIEFNEVVVSENRVCGVKEKECEVSVPICSENNSDIDKEPVESVNDKHNEIEVKIEKDIEMEIVANTILKISSVLRLDEVVVKQESKELSNDTKTSKVNEIVNRENEVCGDNEKECEVSLATCSKNNVDSDKEPVNNNNHQRSVQIPSDKPQATKSKNMDSNELETEITLPGSDVRVDESFELKFPVLNQEYQVSHNGNEAAVGTPVVIKCETIDESDFLASNNIQIKEEGIDFSEYCQTQIENVDIKQEFPEDENESYNVFEASEAFVQHTKDRHDILQVLCNMSAIKTEASSPEKKTKKNRTPSKIKKKKLKDNKEESKKNKTERFYKCSNCGLKFRPHKGYLMHKMQCLKKEGPSQSSENVNAYPEKVFVRQKNSEYPCSKCNKSFLSMKFYLSHLPTHRMHGNTCPVCYKVYPNFTLLSHDINRHVRQMFLNVQVLEQNERIFSSKKNGIYQCKTCSSNVEYASMFEHWERHLSLIPRKKRIFVQDSDEEDFDNDKSDEKDDDEQPGEGNIIDKIMKQLLTKDRRGLVKTCIACLRRFYRNNDCKRHLIEHLLSDAHAKFNFHGELRCQKCGDGFITADSYKHHMRQHGELPVFKCELCDRTFSDSSNFAKHKKVHNFHTLQCDICKKKFTSKVGLEKHIEMHSTMEPIKCELCFQVYFSRSAYNRHYKLKHDRSWVHHYRCRYCRLPFRSNRALWEHLWEVHKSRKDTADCPICHAPFRKKSDVLRHAKAEHNVNLFRSKKLLKDNQRKTTATNDNISLTTDNIGLTTDNIGLTTDNIALTTDNIGLTTSPSCTSLEEFKSTSDNTSIKEELVVCEIDDDDDEGRLVINI